MIKGRTVNLRRLTIEDMPKVFEWWQDIELMKYYDELPVNSPLEIEHELRLNINTTNRIDFIIETKKKEPIGRIFLSKINWKNRHSELHIMIGDKSKKNMFFGAEAGFLLMLYAFHQLNMHKIYGRMMEYAKEVETLQKEIGFRKEAVLKNKYFQKGRYWDFFIYGLLDREFENLLNSSKGQKYFFASQGSYKN